jgi:hypothetical protein
MAIVMAVMAGAMVAGTVATSIYSSTEGISNSCGSLQAAKAALLKEQNVWSAIMGDVNIDTIALRNSQEQMATNTSVVMAATKQYHDHFKQQQTYINAGIVVFLFSVFLLLIMKRLDIWGKIRSFF